MPGSSSEWPRVSLENVCVRITSGGTPSRRRPEFFASADGEGHPWVKSSELDDGYVSVTEESITEDGLAGSSAKYLPAETVLMAMYGATVGKVGLLLIPATVNQAVCGMTVDVQKVDARFLFHALKHWRPSLVAQAHGAAQQNLSQGLIRSFEIPVPPTATQHKIAAVLSAYDDLIANNTRRIAILEDMARTIYREWFVEFRYPGHETVPLVESELGPIPEGWDVVDLFDVGTVTYGFAFKSKAFNEGPDGQRVVRIRDVPNSWSSTFTTETCPPKYEIQDGDVLVGMDGNFHMCRWSGGPALLNQRVARFVPNADIPVWFLFLAVEAPVKYLNATITGTTVAHLGDRHLRQVRVVRPPSDLLARVAEILDPLQLMEMTLQRANRVLRTKRDLLLPRLVSGEVDVSDLGIDVGVAS